MSLETTGYLEWRKRVDEILGFRLKKLGLNLKPLSGNPPVEEPVLINVICKDCKHFKVDAVNPKEGMGSCSVDGWVKGQPLLYPQAKRTCDRFQSVS